MTFRLLGENIPKEIEAMQEGFRQRGIFVDCRGTIRIDPTAAFGFNIQIYTQSHDINDFSIVVDRPVIVKFKAFIGSGVILYNCTIGEHSIVSVGSIVKNITIPPCVIVSGNPLKIIAVKSNEKDKWKYLKKGKEIGE